MVSGHERSPETMIARRVPAIAGPGLWMGLDGDRFLRSGCRRPVGCGSFGRCDLRLIFVGLGLDLVVISEEIGQSVRFAGRRMAGGAGLGEPKWLGEPACPLQEAFGLARHVTLLEMVDELRRRLALGLAHRFENTGLGDPTEIIVDARRPTCRDPVEADRTRQDIGLVEPAADAMRGDAA